VRPELRLPPDDLPPLLWKEIAFGPFAPPSAFHPAALARDGRVLFFLMLGGALMFLALSGVAPTRVAAWSTTVNYVPRVLALVLASIGCLGVGIKAAGCISRERDAQTLAGLMTLPVESEEILRAKWLGSLLQWRGCAYGVLACVFCGVGLWALHPWAGLLLLVAYAVHASFLASLGVWLSLSCRTTLWANLSMALVLLLFFTGSFLGMTTFDEPMIVEATWLDSLRAIGLSPVRTWWFVGFSWPEPANALVHLDVLFWRRLSAVLVGLALYGLAAWGLWRSACRRFRAEVQRTGG
jgi:hypothetical protein